ncbi:MAG: hypothetical protein ACRDPW_01200 [Mycobacteriales bacterium]
MFLGAAAGLVTAASVGGLARVATADSERGMVTDSERALGDLDLPEYTLTDYSQRVTPYTTAWGVTVEDWYPAFWLERGGTESSVAS